MKCQVMDYPSEQFNILKKEISKLIKNEKYDQILNRLDLFDRKNLIHISESTSPKEQTKENSDPSLENYIYKSLLDITPSGICIFTKDKFLFVNIAWLKVLGYSEEEAYKMNPLEFVHPDMRKEVDQRADMRIRGEDVPKRYDMKILTKDKSVKWIDLTLSLIQFENKKATLCIFNDITEMYNTRVALMKSEEKFRRLTELSPAAICIQTTDKFLWANPAWSEISGYPLDEVLKMGPLDVIHPDMQENAKKRSESRLNSEDVTSRYNLKILTKNKKVKWVDIAVSVIQFEGQTASLALSSDVTKQVNAQKALKESEEKYRSLIENLRSEYFFYRHNIDGIFEYVSPSIIHVLGYSQEEFLTHYNKYLTDNPINKIADEKTKLAINGIQQLPYELEIYNIQKKEHTLEISEIPIIDNEGNVSSIEGIAHDITSQKKAEETIKNQIKEIQIHNEEVKAISEEAKVINEDLEARIVEINNLNEELKTSENKFRTLVENIPGVVYRCLMQDDWEMKFISKEIEAISGYPDSDFINNRVRSYGSVIHPDDTKDVVNYIEKEISLKKSFSFEYRIVDKEGKIKWVYEKGQAELDSNNKVKWLDGVILDITEQKKADQALQESKKLYEKLVVNQGEALVIVNNEDEFIFTNPAAYEIFGVPEGKLVGRNVKEFITDEYIREVSEQTEKRKIGAKSTYELEIKRPDNSKRFILVTASPEYNKENEIIGAFAIFRDITERKKTENALIESEMELRKSNTQKDKFFSLVAHDLRSPIGNFVQISELLRFNYEELSKEQSHNFFKNLHILADRTFTLLENLLMWSRSQLGRLEIEKQEIELYNTVNEVAGLYEENFNSKNIQFKNEIPQNLIVKTDLNIVQTVLRNLISNAIKFSYEEGEIAVGSCDDKDILDNSKCHIMYVKDTGVGIPRNKIKKIFNIDEEFTTLGTASEKGTGLGLILCKELIETNGGEIWVESKKGQGSKFYFTLKP
ncbi:MAG: PAS domain S-box protein [Bacteroidales bacterium]|nr:PAS domain S-box protein [Bacteroidales bacterium]